MDRSRRVLNQTMNDALHIHASESLEEQVSYASRSFSGHEDEHSLARPYNPRHAVMEKVDGQLQVFVGEVKALRPHLPGLQSDHSCHITLGDTQKLKGLVTKVIGCGEGQGSQVIEILNGLMRE
jgi:hypothetical protein